MPPIPFRGFCGPSYQLTNKFAAIERTVNWFLSPNEAQREETKDDYFHEPTPGNQQFSELPVPAPFNQPNRGLIELHEEAYGVNGTVAFHISKTGAMTQLGTVVSDGKPVSMTANGNAQIFIASGRQGYVIGAAGAGSSFTAIPTTTDGFLGASFTTFQDGYIIVVTPDSQQFQISGDDNTPVGDATIWSAANVDQLKGQADNLRAMISSREYLRALGYRRSQVLYNAVGVASQAGFPFQSYNETFIETGLAATFSLLDLGDSLAWIGQDVRGTRAFWRDAGFAPERVSTFAVEQAWEGYASIADAVAFAFIWQGHLHVRITFPSARIDVRGNKTAATWDYDVTASLLTKRPIWTELQYLTSRGFLIGRPEMFHCYAYGKHLVGSAGADGNPGAIYQYANVYTDCGLGTDGSQVQQQIVRDRICPHLYNAGLRTIYNRIRFDIRKGVGLDGAPGVGTDPQLYIRWSDDGGENWSDEDSIPVGKIGQFSQPVEYLRAGYGRDRVFWVRYSDPTYMGLVGAYLDVIPLSS